MGTPLRLTLLASHGTLTALLVAAVAFAYFRGTGASQAARDHCEIEAVRSQTANKMAAGVLEVGFATLDHMDDHDPKHLDRIRSAEAEYDRAIRDYRGTDADARTQAWAQQAEADFRSYAAVSRALIADDSRLPADVKEFARLRDAHRVKIEAMRAAAANGGHPRARQLGELGSRVHDLAQHLLDCKHRPTAGAKAEFDAAAGDCLRLAADLRSAAAHDQTAPADAEQSTQQIVRLAAHIEESVRTKRERIAELTRLRRELIDLLTGELQAASSRGTAGAIATMDRTSGANRWALASFCAAAVIVGAWVCAFTARSITGQVQQLVRATQALDRGDYAARVPDGPVRELNELARSFNQMIADQHQTRAWLHAANETLEERVRERTAELTRANDALRVESIARELAQQQFFEAQRLEVVGHLAGGVAHDFNNLMTVVNGCCFRLDRRAEHDPPVEEIIRTIQEVVAEAARITRWLLTISRHRSTHPHPVSLNDVLERARASYIRVLREDIECAIDLAADAGRVVADEGQVEQVVLNLVVNARDAMPDGGRITVSTRSRRDPDGRAWVVLAVEDTGHGMSAEVREQAFEPFFTTKEVGKGSGMGLAVVKGVIERAGGRIEVESRPGRGTRFSLYFPAAADSPPTDAEDHNSTTGVVAPGPGVVLVVEDDKRVRAVAVSILQAAGYTVVEAGDAVSGMREATARAAELAALVTDIVMPGPSGWKLAAGLAGLLPAVRIVIVTGHSERELLSPQLAGFEYTCLEKPYAAKALLQAVGGGRGQAAGRGVTGGDASGPATASRENV